MKHKHYNLSYQAHASLESSWIISQQTTLLYVTYLIIATRKLNTTNYHSYILDRQSKTMFIMVWLQGTWRFQSPCRISRLSPLPSHTQSHGSQGPVLKFRVSVFSIDYWWYYHLHHNNKSRLINNFVYLGTSYPHGQWQCIKWSYLHFLILTNEPYTITVS